MRAVESAKVTAAMHLARAQFVGLLKRMAASNGVLVGNSSAGLIEAAAIGIPVVDIGPRQSGRERCGNVIHVDAERPDAIAAAVHQARALDRSGLSHPYGDGQAGPRIARALADTNPHDPRLLRKRCAY